MSEGARAQRKRRTATAAVAVALALFFVTDLASGPTARPELAYVLLVLVAGVWGVPYAGLVTAVVAATLDTVASVSMGLRNPWQLLAVGTFRLGVYLVCAAGVTAMVRDRARLRELARRDVTTGLYNRRGFVELAESEIHRSIRYGHPLTVMYLDLDGFKAVNDRYGHQAGDAVLAAVGRELRLSLRSHDVVARLGGDEFAVLLPETSPEGAQAAAANIRARITTADPPAPLPPDHRLQLTIGWATRRQDLPDVEAFLALADEDMYRRRSLDVTAE